MFQNFPVKFLRKQNANNFNCGIKYQKNHLKYNFVQKMNELYKFTKNNKLKQAF